MNDDAYDKLLGQLIGLRKGEGLTPPKLRQADLVMEALTGDSEEISIMKAYDRLMARANELGDTRAGRAVRTALNFERLPGKLLARRDTLARRLGLGHGDTIEIAENEGFKELAHRLADNLALRSPLLAVPKTSDALLYTFEEVTLLYRFTGRAKTEVTASRTVRAEVDGLSIAPVLFKHSAVNHSDVRIDGYAGCRIDSLDQDTPDITRARLALSRTLNRGDRHRYTYRIHLNTAEPSKEWVTTVENSQIQVDRTLFQVQFDTDAVPTRAWWLAGTTYFALPGKPTPDNGVPIDDHGYAEKEFKDLKPNLHHSVAWKWPD